MFYIRTLSLILFLFISLAGCIKRVDVKTRNEKPILVVEGSITTDSVPYTVRLTYSGALSLSDNLPDEFLEKEAVVSISDNLGNSTTLIYTTDGIYKTTDPNYVGQPGRSYTVKIVLKNGTEYISAPEKIQGTVSPFTVKAAWINDFDMNLPTYLNVSVDTKDPAGEENYYLWTFDAWIMRQTKGVSCGFGCIQFEYCYQKYKEPEVHILTDRSVNGNDIKNQTVGRTYIYTFGNPYIEIGQHLISRSAYQFWQSYNDQQERTGGILDPLPASIRGNVYNASNESDFALGYFSASAVIKKKVVLVPFSISQYLLDISAKIHIPDQSIACFDYFPNTLVYPVPGQQFPPPPGWENAEQLKVFW